MEQDQRVESLMVMLVLGMVVLLEVQGMDRLMEMRKKGAWTLGQDQESSIVYGMPKAALEKRLVELTKLANEEGLDQSKASEVEKAIVEQ